MIVELIPASGIGCGQALRLAVSQVLIRQDNGTPICVAAEYGPEGAQAVSKAGDDDFNRILKTLGVDMLVRCDRIEMPQPPPGARLIAGPKFGG